MLQRIFKHICITDLDGTLLDLDHSISDTNMQTLNRLRELQVCRVAATGRSLYSLKKVLSTDMPFDYVIFSTGAGIMKWQTQSIILAIHIEKKFIRRTFQILHKLNVDFMVHAPIPDNHRFVYVKGKGLPDFQRRIGIYEKFAEAYSGDINRISEEVTQFLVVADSGEENLYPLLIRELEPLKVIRTTSPLDHHSLWLEIFAPEVDKGTAARYLLDLLGLNRSNLCVIGNDFNDLDMLKMTSYAFVTDNAPQTLKNAHKVVSDHNHHGFAEAVSIWLNNIIK